MGQEWEQESHVQVVISCLSVIIAVGASPTICGMQQESGLLPMVTGLCSMLRSRPRIPARPLSSQENLAKPATSYINSLVSSVGRA